MLAKFHAALPFELLLSEGPQYTLYSYSFQGYEVQVDLPSRASMVTTNESSPQIKLNGFPAFQANVLNITFRKESFDRRIEGEIDPPAEVIKKVVLSFLERLKFAGKIPQVKMINFPHCPWEIEYLNDDGTELDSVIGQARAKFSMHFSFQYNACDPALWEIIHSIPSDFIAPAWHTLLVDSRGALPHVGTTIVLAATGLEVLISGLTESLGRRMVGPSEIWDWINDRGDWQKEPSVEEQYSVLLKILTGHSLKEDKELWEGFRNLRTARNCFVHQGVPMVGKKELSIGEAIALIDKADQIVAKIRDWLPEEDRWPVYQHSVQLEMVQPIVPNSPLVAGGLAH